MPRSGQLDAPASGAEPCAKLHQGHCYVLGQLTMLHACTCTCSTYKGYVYKGLKMSEESSEQLPTQQAGLIATTNNGTQGKISARKRFLTKLIVLRFSKIPLLILLISAHGVFTRPDNLLVRTPQDRFFFDFLCQTFPFLPFCNSTPDPNPGSRPFKTGPGSSNYNPTMIEDAIKVHLSP